MFERVVYKNDIAESTERFLWDGYNPVARVDGSGKLLQSCLWGLDLSGTPQGAGGVGGLLAVTDLSGDTDETYFPFYDGNGNVTGYADASDGSISCSFDYGPFGEPVKATGEAADKLDYRFSTKFTDDVTGIVHFELRPLDTQTGRWPTRDPIEEQGGLNLYGFVNNDPINQWDYLGLLTIVRDDAKRECHKSCLVKVWMRVDAPQSSVPEQIFEDVTLRQIALRAKHGQATPSDFQTLGNRIDTGHTFLFFEKINKKCNVGIGFYPGGSWFGKPGQLKDDTNHKYDSSREYKFCPETMEIIYDEMKENYINPPIYSLDSMQCSTWAVGILREAGVNGLPVTCTPFSLSRLFEKRNPIYKE